MKGHLSQKLLFWLRIGKKLPRRKKIIFGSIIKSTKKLFTLKATVKGAVKGAVWKKLSPKESVEGAHTVVRGSVGFSLVKCEGPHVPLVKCEGPHFPLVMCEDPHIPLVKCEGPHVPLLKCEGSYVPLVKCENFSSKSVDGLSAFSRYVWPIKSHTATD